MDVPAPTHIKTDVPKRLCADMRALWHIEVAALKRLYLYLDVPVLWHIKAAVPKRLYLMPGLRYIKKAAPRFCTWLSICVRALSHITIAVPKPL